MFPDPFKTAAVTSLVATVVITEPAFADNFMKIMVKTVDHLVPVTLDDNPTSRDFVALLPLTLTLRDYASTEKISDLPRNLSTRGAPSGINPVAGDVTYYSPWGNLAIFYKGFKPSSGLIRLGRVDTGLAALTQSGSLEVTIEAIEE